MKKVIGFNGSPRKSFNTKSLVKTILEGAEKKGAETKLYDLAKMNIGGCIGCVACRRGPDCSIKDDMSGLLEEIKSADAVVFGSPVYMLQMTSQTKAFIDRLFPIIKNDFSSVLKAGTKALFVYTQGTVDTEAFRSYFNHNENMLQHFGFTVEKSFAIGNTRAKGDFEKQEDKVKEAMELGSNLVI